MTQKNLTKEDVLYVAKLAKLSLSEEEVEIYTEQLAEVIGHINELDKIDVTGVDSTTHPIDLENVTFEDGMEKEEQITFVDNLHVKHVGKKTYFIVDRLI